MGDELTIGTANAKTQEVTLQFLVDLIWNSPYSNFFLDTVHI